MLSLLLKELSFTFHLQKKLTDDFYWKLNNCSPCSAFFMSVYKDPVICLSSNWDCMTTIFQLHFVDDVKLLQR